MADRQRGERRGGRRGACVAAGLVLVASLFVVVRPPGAPRARAQDASLAAHDAAHGDARPGADTDGGSEPEGGAPPASGSADRLEAARRAGLAALAARTAPDAWPSGEAAPSRRMSARERETFWAWDFHRQLDYRLSARLRHASPVVWIYEEEGAEVPGAAVARLARTFEDRVRPALRLRFGTEPSPGIDGEQAITILLLDIRDDTAYGQAPYRYVSGYFDPAHQVAQAAHEQRGTGRRSNAREMVYLDVDPTQPEGDVILQTLAHEYAHLITWNYDPTEATWLAESLGQLAIHVSGLGVPEAQLEAFLEAPDGSLTAWEGSPRDYGRAFAFGLYLFEQLGGNAADAGRLLVQDPLSGMSSVAGLLPRERSAAELLRDFGLALQLDLPSDTAPRLGFAGLELGRDGGLPYARAHEHAEGALPDGRTAAPLAPWSLRLDRFALGAAPLEIGMQSTGTSCYGAGRPPTDRDPVVRTGEDARVDLRCAPLPGAPWILRAPPADGPGQTLVTVVANGSGEPATLRMLATRATSANAPDARLYLPLALGTRRAR